MNIFKDNKHRSVGQILSGFARMIEELHDAVDRNADEMKRLSEQIQAKESQRSYLDSENSRAAKAIDKLQEIAG